MIVRKLVPTDRGCYGETALTADNILGTEKTLVNANLLEKSMKMTARFQSHAQELAERFRELAERFPEHFREIEINDDCLIFLNFSQQAVLEFISLKEIDSLAYYSAQDETPHLVTRICLPLPPTMTISIGPEFRK